MLLITFNLARNPIRYIQVVPTSDTNPHDFGQPYIASLGGWSVVMKQQQLAFHVFSFSKQDIINIVVYIITVYLHLSLSSISYP